MTKSIHVSSFETDFTSEIQPPIDLNPETNYEITLLNASMYYSWTNISADQGNNIFIYNNGTTDMTVPIPDGNWTLGELSDILPSEITISPVFAIQSVRISITGGYSLKFLTGTPYHLLGFNLNQILNSPVNDAPNRADITNGVDNILIHCSLVNDENTFVNGKQANLLYTIPAMSVPTGTYFNAVNDNNAYSIPLNTTKIASFRIWLTDQDNRPINNMGERSNYTLLITEVN